MAKMEDWGKADEAKDIMEKFLDKFPIFEGFDIEQLAFFLTKKKKSKVPIKVHALGYPQDALCNKLYIIEVFDYLWGDMDQKKKNLAVWRAMCAIPEGAFDPRAKNYGKKLQPQIKMYIKEYNAAGGVYNWMENPAAADPMESKTVEEIQRTPITLHDVESAVDGSQERIAATG